MYTPCSWNWLQSIVELSEPILLFIKQIYKNLNLEFIENNNYIIEINKQKIKFITIQNNNIYQVMDATKISDFVMFVLSGKNQVDHFGDLCISTIKSQVIPSVINIVQVLLLIKEYAN